MPLDESFLPGNSLVPTAGAPNALLLVALRQYRQALNDALSKSAAIFLTPKLLSADRQAQVLLLKFDMGR